MIYNTPPQPNQTKKPPTELKKELTKKSASHTALFLIGYLTF